MLFTKSMPGLKKINKWTILKKPQLTLMNVVILVLYYFFFLEEKLFIKILGRIKTWKSKNIWNFSLLNSKYG